MEYKLLIDGQWVEGGSTLEVKNKYSDETIGTVPTARKEDVDTAIAAAERAWPNSVAPERARPARYLKALPMSARASPGSSEARSMVWSRPSGRSASTPTLPCAVMWNVWRTRTTWSRT